MNGNSGNSGGINVGQILSGGSLEGAAIAAITAANPVLGGVVSAIAGLFKILGIKGPTQHADQREAERVTLDSAIKLTENYQRWFGVHEVDRIAQRLSDRFRDHVQSRLTTPLSEYNLRIKDWDRQFARRITHEFTFFHVNWAALIWSFRSIDAEHPEQFEEYYSPFRSILAEETRRAIETGVWNPSVDSPFRVGSDVGTSSSTSPSTSVLPLAAAAGALWFIMKR